MRKLTVFVVATLVCMVVGGCKRDHEKVMKDQLACSRDLVDVLKSIKDEASAKAAEVKMKSIAERMKALKEEADKLPKLSADEVSRLAKAHEKEINEISSAMSAELMRIAGNRNFAQVQQMFKSMNDSFGSLKK